MDGLNFIFDRFAQFNPSNFNLVYGILLLLVHTTHFTLLGIILPKSSNSSNRTVVSSYTLEWVNIIVNTIAITG